MTRGQLFEQIKNKSSYLCVGLDTDITKIPKHLLYAEDPVFEFNRQIIDATADFTIAYKLNTAFYEANGIEGWKSLEQTINYIPNDIFIIADAKRGDIGNTSSMYAKAFFRQLHCDAITVAPYMGEDSIKPFLEFENKWTILLALTSNPSGKEFQELSLNQGGTLYEEVLKKSLYWGGPDQLMYVIGATRTEALRLVRQIVPDHFLLVPGVGTQGGNLKEVSHYGMNSECGLLVNSSRGIIYADASKYFAIKAQEKARKLQEEMSAYLFELL